MECKVWSINQCTLGHPCHFCPPWALDCSQAALSESYLLCEDLCLCPSEAGGRLDSSQGHCASLPVGGRWTGLSCSLLYPLPSAGREASIGVGVAWLSTNQTLASQPRRGVQQASQVPGSVGLLALSLSVKRPQTQEISLGAAPGMDGAKLPPGLLRPPRARDELCCILPQFLGFLLPTTAVIVKAHFTWSYY